MTAEPQRPERLHRLGVLYIRNLIFFVTACTVRRKAILANEQTHKALIEFAQIGEKRGAFVGAYVLMPDHFHLFVWFNGSDLSLAIWVKSLKNRLSKDLRERGVATPHWQKGFFDHVLRSGESYTEKWNYVCENPVRAGLVQTAESWPYAGEIFPLEFLSDR